MLDNLTFSCFKAYFNVKGPLPVQLPPYSGSAFRGALGHAMREVRYGMSPGCSECPVRSECRYQNLYAYFFESPGDHPFICENSRTLNRYGDNFPQPFILDPPRGGLYPGFIPGERFWFSQLSWWERGYLLLCTSVWPTTRMATGWKHVLQIVLPD